MLFLYLLLCVHDTVKAAVFCLLFCFLKLSQKELREFLSMLPVCIFPCFQLILVKTDLWRWGNWRNLKAGIQDTFDSSTACGKRKLIGIPKYLVMLLEKGGELGKVMTPTHLHPYMQEPNHWPIWRPISEEVNVQLSAFVRPHLEHRVQLWGPRRFWIWWVNFRGGCQDEPPLLCRQVESYWTWRRLESL